MLTDNRIVGGFEESACCLQETVLIMAVWKKGMDQAGQSTRRSFKLKGSERTGKYMSKITKGIQDKETFTRTKCTSTVVIYKYSSPSSFQLSENKKSKCKEQLKDPITQLFWRADTIEHVHVVAVLHSPRYLHVCTYMQVQFAR